MPLLSTHIYRDMENMQWAEALNCAVTVCDANGIILYMNRKSRDTFASHGNLIGKNLFECHSEASIAKIRHMLATGESNAYTIEKNGVHKVIYQSPWRDADGNIAGMVEISMVTPAEMPHYIR
jgi:DUF438 domain-containing protein